MSKFDNEDGSVTRRDYLNSALLGAGSALLGAACPMHLLGRENDFDGYSGVGDYCGANGNTLPVLTAGHTIRDRVFEPLPKDVTDTGETFDCVVVGGGISGLSAALAFQRKAGPHRTCLVLEDHSVFGGEARRNEFVVDGQRLIAHQGSAMFFPQFEGSFLDGFYRSIGIEQNAFQYQAWNGSEREMALGNTPYAEDGPTLGYYFGRHFGGDPATASSEGTWLIDPWVKKLQGAPLSDESRQQFLKTRIENPAFRAPERHGDAVSRYLDSITLEQHLMDMHGICRETVRQFLSPVSGGGSGIGADVLSAYADYAADVLLPWDQSKGAQMFPGGNAGVARLILKALIPDSFAGPAGMAGVANSAIHFPALDRSGQASRIRLNATVVHVGQDETARSAEASIVYSVGQKLYRVRARSVVMAGGSWTTKHVVEDLPASHREAYAQFHRSPCVMANVAVRNWRFLYKMGIDQFQWFGVGPGNYTAVHKTATMGGVSPHISPDSPAVLSIKILFSKPGVSLHEQGVMGRTELLATPFSVYEKQIRSMFAEMFSRSGFEQSDVAGIVLNRWGHAYLSAQPGFFFGSQGKPAPGDVLRSNPVGRISFANSDLTGIMDHRCSIIEAHRAVSQAIQHIA